MIQSIRDRLPWIAIVLLAIFTLSGLGALHGYMEAREFKGGE